MPVKVCFFSVWVGGESPHENFETHPFAPTCLQTRPLKRSQIETAWPVWADQDFFLHQQVWSDFRESIPSQKLLRTWTTLQPKKWSPTHPPSTYWGDRARSPKPFWQRKFHVETCRGDCGRAAKFRRRGAEETWSDGYGIPYHPWDYIPYMGPMSTPPEVFSHSVSKIAIKEIYFPNHRFC